MSPPSFLLSPRTPDGSQERLGFALDTDRLDAGLYGLRISQADVDPRVLPLEVHLPLPQLSNLPLRVNLGEKSQEF